MSRKSNNTAGTTVLTAQYAVQADGLELQRIAYEGKTWKASVSLNLTAESRALLDQGAPAAPRAQVAPGPWGGDPVLPSWPAVRVNGSRGLP